MSADSRARTPIESNHRIEDDSSRTGTESSGERKSLKALAQRVLQAGSTSNQHSIPSRTNRFETPSQRPPSTESDSIVQMPIVSNHRTEPDAPCPACGSGQWWQLPGQPWHCRACEADMPLEATSLTLPCHKPQARPVRDPARLSTVFEACKGLSATPEQLGEELADDRYP